jgi:hypothetical protein
LLYASKEEANIDLKGFGDIPKPRSADAISARFVFLDLLKLDPDLLGQLLLCYAHKPSTMSNSLANVHVHWMRHVIPFLGLVRLAPSGRAI